MASRLNALLDDNRVARLAPFAITDVVDLVGALEVDHDSIGRLLELDPDEVDLLHARALDSLPPELREVISNHRSRPLPMGARDPDDS